MSPHPSHGRRQRSCRRVYFLEGLPAASTPAGLFVVRLSADSSSLLAGTYFGGAGTTYSLGGSQADSIAAMKLDSAGNIHIAGNANSIPFPTTPGAYQRDRSSVKRDPCSEGPDQFVAKFDPTLKSLIFSTLIGTAGRNAAFDLVLGPDGSIYTAGTHGSERSCPTDAAWVRENLDSRTRGGPGGRRLRHGRGR